MKINFRVTVHNAECLKLLTVDGFFSGTERSKASQTEAFTALKAAASAVNGTAKLAIIGAEGDLSEITDEERVLHLSSTVKDMAGSAGLVFE